MQKYLVKDNVQSNISGYLLFQYLINIYPPLNTKSKRKQLEQWLLGNRATPSRTYFSFCGSRVVDLKEPAAREGKIKDNGEGMNSAVFSDFLL